jgi:hypothetical protein
VTESLFDQFKSGAGGGDEEDPNAILLGRLPGSAIVLPGGGPALTGTTPLLDGTVFQKLFNSGVITQPPSATHGGSTTVASEQGEGQSPAPGAEAAPLDGAAPGPQAGLPAMQLTIVNDLGGQITAMAVAASAGRKDESVQANVSITAGAAGLVAGRQLLDRGAMAGAVSRPKARTLARKALDAVTHKWFGGASSETVERGEVDDTRRARRSRIEW